ncbi:hypothetical protein DUNSADRAFT_17397 [Dunaliella salina]|uniref:Sulfotransferase n=1 Tax=Dunaliella salina TaxID=3046 RepID=A0ABQ7G1U5_DUNSA|nr:hypothetical protein DUNSADRAFT_17397 [Dunaliella salina]|eukprot:KAF5828573.1 hypothetical protein DUNSADRAFT_17397 [Dunaliella salina]
MPSGDFKMQLAWFALAACAMHCYALLADSRPLFVWHPMKTGGTSLCQAMAQYSSIYSEEFNGKMDTGRNCKIGKKEQVMLHNCTGKLYSEINIPAFAGVLESCLRRSFVFYEPSWEARTQFATYPLPAFLQPGSATFLTYRHVFLIRHPIERIASLFVFFRLSEICNTSSTTLLSNLLLGLHQTRTPNCEYWLSVFSQQVSNVYVQHLTGTQSDVQTSKVALSFITTIDVTKSCSQWHLKTLLPGLSIDHLRKYSGDHFLVPPQLLPILKQKLANDLDLYHFHQKRDLLCQGVQLI